MVVSYNIVEKARMLNFNIVIIVNIIVISKIFSHLRSLKPPYYKKSLLTFICIQKYKLCKLVIIKKNINGI